MTKLEKLIEKRNDLCKKIQFELECLYPKDFGVSFVISGRQKVPSTGTVIAHHGWDATVVVKMDKLSKEEQFRKLHTGYGQHTVKHVNWKDMR